MIVPQPRGPLSASVIRLLTSQPEGIRQDNSIPEFRGHLHTSGDALTNGDLQLALAVSYETAYCDLDGVDPRWEWHPEHLERRSLLAQALEDTLLERVAMPKPPSGPVWRELRHLVTAQQTPSVAKYLAQRGSHDQVCEFLKQKSVYHLREGDAHTWGIPRLRGAAKAALVEIQADEYGGGRAARMHSALFAQTLRAAGLSDEYGRYWDEATAQTLAALNTISLFGLHRRLRGALCGHLAAFEMTSTGPNMDYSRAVRRVGLPAIAAEFFVEHVEADAVHEELAAVDLCGALARGEPHLAQQILWGAACALHVDAAAGQELLARWGALEAAVA